MSSRKLLVFSIRLFFAWIASAVFFYFFGRVFISFFLPFLSLLTNIFVSDFSSQMILVEQDNIISIQMNAIMKQDIYIQGIAVTPQDTLLSSAVHLIHVLVPIVIFWSLFLALPTKNKRERIGFSVFAFFANSLLLSLIIPPLLTGHIEEKLFSAAQNVTENSLIKPWILYWVVFLETGGLWLLALTICTITYFFSQAVNSLLQKNPLLVKR